MYYTHTPPPPKADEAAGRRVEGDCDLGQGERGELVRRDTAARSQPSKLGHTPSLALLLLPPLNQGRVVVDVNLNAIKSRPWVRGRARHSGPTQTCREEAHAAFGGGAAVFRLSIRGTLPWVSWRWTLLWREQKWGAIGPAWRETVQKSPPL